MTERRHTVAALHTCARCRGPLPIDFAAYIGPDGTRTCLGTCRPLYLFENSNPDWVVAHDADDALDVWCKHVGETRDGYDPEDWEQRPDDHTAKYWIDPDTGGISDDGDGNTLVELSALEVVGRWGRGFIASVDF